MRRSAVGLVAVAVVVFGAACSEAPVSPEQVDVTPSLGVSSTGNGAPSGTHYTLNIIGVERKGNPANSRSNGRRIFVPLFNKCDIGLQQGSFDVLDYLCGFDGDRAEFQLPNPVGTSGNFAYSVYARALGKPGGSARMAACYEDAVTGEEWCNTSVVTLSRTGGKSTFSNVSRQLLQVCADVNADPTITDLRYVGLFDAVGSDYWWEYDNTGLRLAQLRFYPIPTGSDIGTACDGGRIGA